MDYEKKYKEANDKVAIRFGTNVAKEIFTDLYESEDERIRKELISALKFANVKGVYDEHIAWLERQAAQKPVNDTDEDIVEAVKDTSILDMVEPKFQNGQWIVWKDKYYKVNYNGCGYELIGQDGLSTSLEYGTVDENAHLFTIQDAKDGDVLISFCNQPFIYNGKFTEITVGGYCGLDVYGNFIEKSTKECNWTCNKDIKPATKEQRDLLLQKMKKAGYEWSDKDRKLIKIAQ